MREADHLRRRWGVRDLSGGRCAMGTLTRNPKGAHRRVASTEAVNTTVHSSPSWRSSAAATSGLSAPAHTILYSRSSRGRAYLGAARE